MGATVYHNFDLLISRSEPRYRARVVQSLAGEAASDFELPFSADELAHFLVRRGQARGGRRGLGPPTTAVSAATSVEAFGASLYGAVFTGAVGECLRTSLVEARREGAGIRVRLRLAEVPELAVLPWEFLRHPALDRHLSLSGETSLVRYLDLPESARSLHVRPPLRLLVMIAIPSDQWELDVEKEWADLRQALGDLEHQRQVELERLDGASWSALQTRLMHGEYHVFHFIGHGRFDHHVGDGTLLFEDREGHHDPVSGKRLGQLLHNHPSLRLVVLNSCEGARPSRTDPFAGVAQNLVQQGIPAVIAMQFEISDRAALAFAEGLYAAVANGYPVDAALTEARLAILGQGNDFEWGTPVLYLRDGDGLLFEMEGRRRPRTHVVDAGGSGEHATIVNAIRAANPGDRIVVRPGRYRDGLVVDKPLEILGEGGAGAVVVEAHGEAALLFKATHGRVANLTLRQTGGRNRYGVDIAQGTLDLEGCDITSRSLSCVAIHGSANPRLHGNRIHDGARSGVVVFEDGRGMLKGNDIFGNAAAGLSIHTRGDPIVCDNRISGGLSNGVYIHEDGRGTLERNAIFRNAEAGVEIKSGGNPTLRENHIYQNGSVGIRVHGKGRGTIVGNDLRGNAGGAWDVATKAQGRLECADNRE